MLSSELMGVLALGILWVNTLLVAAAAYKEAVGLSARRDRLSPTAHEGTGLVWGRVVRGAGPGGEIAAHRVEQVGRAMEGARPAIVFADRSVAGEVLGGAVRLVGDGGEVEVEPQGDAEVWLRGEELARAAECPSDAAFDAAYEPARKARGFSRTAVASIGLEREVFLFGQLRAKGAGRSLGRAREGGMLIATFDPRAWIDGRIRLVVFFIIAEIAVAAGCSAVALAQPHFGLVSKLGGALCLAFFLLVQPAGTMIREAVRVPSQAHRRGRWRRGAAGELSRSG